MTEFIFTTNDLNSTTYDGPSGIRYVIYRNNPFKVISSEDIEFFRKNPRFKEVGVIESIIEKVIPSEPKKTDDEILKEELDKIKLSKKTEKELLKSYLSLKDLIDDLEEGYNLGPKIRKAELNKLKFHLLKK